MRRFTSLTAITVLLLLMTAALGWGQTAFTVQIIATERGNTVDTMVLGVHSTATYGIDAIHGEYELPPFPVDSIAAARFVHLPGHTSLGEGVRTDIRPLVFDAQADSYLVAFAAPPESETDIMTFTWTADLSTKGGGRWRMIDLLGGVLGVDVDMTTTNSVDVNFATLAGGGKIAYFYIIKSDTTSFRTFESDVLALDVDAKGKAGKPNKPASYRVDFCITIPNATGASVSKLHLEWSTDILNSGDLDVEPAPDVSAKDEKNKKFDFTWTDSVGAGESVTICGLGNKGKQMKVTYYWMNGATMVGAKVKAAETAFSKNIPQVPMPNTVNGGIEAMTALFVKPNALNVGVLATNSDGQVKAVAHPTYNDVLKTLVKKGVMHTGDPRCLDYFFKDGAPVTTKSIVKLQKTLPLDKHNNMLLAEALTLKMNVVFSDAGVTPSGFGDVTVNDATSDFDGLTVDQISAEIDSFLACGYEGPLTADDYYDIAIALNSSFVSDLDTIRFASATDTKNGDPKFTGSASISDVLWLAKGTGTAPRSYYGAVPPSFFSETPQTYELMQNYPNPFNPTTTIEFNLVDDAFVTVKVYNLLGQEVATLANRDAFDAGMNSLDFNAASLSSGMYFYRLVAVNAETGDIVFQEVRKMALVK